MTEHVASYRRILKTSSIIGGASVINIVIGLLRTKALAALVGPAGVGLVSLYTSLMATATVVSTMGIGTIGTREVAAALGADDQRALALVRRTMLWGSIALAALGALAVVCLSEVIAARLLGGQAGGETVRWLALGVAFSVIGTSQAALIQGMRRIGDMAKLSVYGALLNTLVGLFLLWYWGERGLIAFVLVGPLSSLLLGQWYVSRLPAVAAHPVGAPEMLAKWRALVKLGAPFMGAALVAAAVQLWIRVEVGAGLGVDALGHFQAATTISLQYIGFVLAAMGADYYPRLSAVIGTPALATRLVNEQTEIALLLSAPIFVAMIGCAPWVVALLYSAEFAPAVAVLRWQILGDVLKVASWPLGFVIVAAGAGKTFFWTETLVLCLMGGLVAAFAPRFGLQVTGVAFLAAYVLYLPLVYILARRRIAFRWSGAVKKLLAGVFCLCAAVGLVSLRFAWGPWLAVPAAAACAAYALLRIAHMSDLPLANGRLGAMARRALNLVR